MIKFIKGAFVLDEKIESKEEYTKSKKDVMQEIVAWADFELGVELGFGYTDDKQLVCQYRIEGHTQKVCQGLLSELKRMLKKNFPRMKETLQMKGESF